MSSKVGRLVVDLDGTLCEQTAGGDAYALAKPHQVVIDKVNQLYDSGWHVTIHTARGMATFGMKELAEDKYWDVTGRWLNDNGVKYHELVFGKPAGDYYIDDKGLGIAEFVSGNFVRRK